MPRTMRGLSENNTYHIVLKGINAQQIFFDNEDYVSFLSVLKNTCKSYNASLCAYCLMRNHVHLLMQFSERNAAQFFKSFGASFVFRYNAKYDRVGGLFNGRYYSKAINDDEYLLMALKYIHYNPVKAGLCENPFDWTWSSYREYVSHHEKFADTRFIKSILTDKQFLELHQAKTHDIFESLMIDNEIWKVNDKQLTTAVNELRQVCTTDEILVQLKQAGIPAYKIAKLLGVPRDYAYKI